MGIVCSKRKQNTLDTLVPRVSPFGRFGRRLFQRTVCKRGWEEGSLLAASLDALARALHLHAPQALQDLPPDLAQLLLNRLVDIGALNDAAVLSLQGQQFYELGLDAYPERIRDFWVRNLVTETLEIAVLSRTQIDDFVLSAFPYLGHLRTLHLDYCEDLTDAGLVVLNRLPHLEDLSVAGCDGIGPLCLGSIGKLHKLRRLNLNTCHRIWGLDPLRNLTALEKLDLGWCNVVGDKDAAALASLSSLKELRVSYTGLTDAGLGALTALSGLTSVSLGGIRVHDPALADVFRSLTKLRQVDLDRCALAGDGMLRALATAAPLIEGLILTYTSVTDDGIENAVPHMTHLRRLELDSCIIGDDSAKCIATDCAKLECLDLSDTQVGSAGVAALGRLRCLEEINLSHTDVGEWGLEQLARCTTLRRVNLDSRHIGDVGVAHMSTLPKLEVLNLFGAAVTDVGCASIARATNLTSLEICSGAVTDAGVRHLRALTGLRHLSLSQNWKVGNSSIPTILNLSGLTALNLSQSRVTSSAVVALGCMPDLQVLSLAGTRVRAAAVEKLQSMKLDLDVRGVFAAERGL